MMKKLIILFVSMSFASYVQAAGGLNANQIYLGGGVSSNDAFGDDATGFQLFAGMPMPVKMGKAKLLAEVGYMDSGEFDYNVPFFGNVGKYSIKGLWANAVVEMPVGTSINLIGRAGLDFGDDDGLMIGAGIGIPAGKTFDIRFEYVIRDHVDSLQANVVIRI